MAIKEVPKEQDFFANESSYKDIVQELINLNSLKDDHPPSILSCEAIYYQKTIINGKPNLKIQLVFPKAISSLWEIYKDKSQIFTEIQTLNLLIQIISGLVWLWNQHKTQHRDIKLANILVLNENHFALTDFGISKIKESQESSQKSLVLGGTIQYWPPEVKRFLSGCRNLKKLDGVKSDIFGLGIVALVLMNKNISPSQLTDYNEKGKGFQLINKEINKVKNKILKQILSDMLKEDMEQRKTGSYILSYYYQNENKISNKLNKSFKTIKQENGTFVGEVIDGQCNGYGEFTFLNNGCYKGLWKNNQFNGQGKFVWNNGQVYEGDWQNNVRQGLGKMKFGENCYYEGEWNNDKIEGFGLFQMKDGCIYEGNYIQEQKSGNGKFIYSDGSIYKGEWRNDQKNGFGIFIYSDQTQYEGQWKNDKKNGNGKQNYKNGNIYEGEWADNKKEGQGTMTYPDKQSYIGLWENDQKSNLSQQIGNFFDNLKNGFGILK